MPQNPTPVSPVNAAALQEPITLDADGRLIVVGNPGGPVVFAPYCATVVPMLAGSVPAGVVS